MLEITIRVEESELLDILNKKLSKYVSGNEEAIIRQYIFDNVHAQSATFFYGPTNLDEWLKDTLERLHVVYPGEPDYDKWLRLWESETYEDRNYVVTNKLGNLLLVEEI